jgi:hypothetical protein
VGTLFTISRGKDECFERLAYSKKLKVLAGTQTLGKAGFTGTLRDLGLAPQLFPKAAPGRLTPAKPLMFCCVDQSGAVTDPRP